MANDLYRTYEVLIDESVHDDHPKRAKTNKDSRFNPEIDAALRDTHTIFQDAVCYNILCFAGLAGSEPPPGGERGRDFLNPLWKHLTTSAKEGGIQEETRRVIRRLATHYTPLKALDRDGVTAEDFVNLVYSAPLQIRAEMTPEQRQAVLDLRAKCYRILEMFGAPVKENGKQECADMSAFTNTWAGLTSKPDSDTEIPGNLAYDCVSRELKTELKDTLSESNAAALIQKTLRKYAAAAQRRNRKDCGQKFLEERDSLLKAVSEAEALLNSDSGGAKRLTEAKFALAEFENRKSQFRAEFFKNRRDGLKGAVISALEKPLAAKKASDLAGVNEADFTAAKTYLEALHAFLVATHDVEAAADKLESAKKLKDSNATKQEKIEKAEGELTKARSAKDAAMEKFDDKERTHAKQLAARLARKDEARAHGFIRLHYKGGRTGSFENAMFRYWLLRDHPNETVRRVALADFRKFIKDDKPDDEPRLDGVHIAEMPFKSKGADIAFPLFGKKCLGIETIHSSPDWDFDKAAYATAAEDVFKYKIRSQKRAKEVAERVSIVRAFEGSGSLSANESAIGKKIAGMKGDPRWKCDEANRKGIVQLLKGLSGDKEIVSYGLREGTIGGWAEVRKRFLKIHATACKRGTALYDPSLVTELETAVDEEMNANRQGFGSADFFHALCASEYHHLWQEDRKDDQGNVVERFSHNGIKDFIPHYVQYSEAREELMRLLKSEDGTDMGWDDELSEAAAKGLITMPIRFTWPGLLNRHKQPSYRYYDFTAKLDPKFPMQLFRRVRSKDDPTRVEGYKLIPAKEAVLTLAARRLKRDKILNKNGATGEWSSVDALWCPPLILEGEPSPTAATKPVAGKEKQKATDPAEVSFSLIAAPLPGDLWNTVAQVPSATEKEPVHLTVSIKIERDEIAKLQNEGVFFVRKSAKGTEEEDDKRKFLRWPVDIETDKQAAKERAAEEKREAKSTGKPKEKKSAREPDVTPSKLWCAYDGGFLVKQSHFSPEADTKRVPDFHILSIDLGNRFAAAFTRLRIHADPNGEGRVISAEGFNPAIKAELVREGTLRLQGENAKAWDHVRNADGSCQKDAAGNYVYALEDETYGNGGRGRFPTDKEYEEFLKLAGRLVPLESLPPAGKEQTYPELGDHLGFRLKRRIGRLRTLFNLAWRLLGTHERNQQTGTKGKQREEGEKLFHRRIVIETLARSMFPKRPRQEGEQEEPGDLSLRATLAPDDEWQRLKDGNLLDSLKGAAETKRRADLEAKLKNDGAWKWDALAEEVKKQIREYMEGVAGNLEHPPLHKLLAAVVEFCLPLKGRHWRWDNNPAGERLTWHERGSCPECNPNVMGMRGLSMKRLEQILNLRQRCQSFAKLEDRYHGVPTRAGVLGYKGFKEGNYDPQDSNRDERPDCCPKLLERSDRIREQRVDQTAHLILAEALGMELKNPAEVANKKARKAEVDLHGEYKRRLDKDGKPYPRCSVIVLENLERYRTSQERTKSENSRLMKWAHRAIIEKLEDMCRPFGITLMLVDPAFSSHFDSRTGLPGVRVEEVSRGFEQTYPYKRWAEGKTRSGGDTQLAKDIKGLAKLFADNPDYKGNLLLAVEGGKLFCPVQPPAGDGEGLLNADINAAGNIGLRGVADPQRWDVFPRLRTKQISDSEVSVTNWRGWFGRFEKEATERRMKALDAKTNDTPAANQAGDGDNAASESSQSSEYPWFFVEHPKHPLLLGELRDEAYCYEHGSMKFRALPQGVYLKCVERICSTRIDAINASRLKHPHSRRVQDDIPMD